MLVFIITSILILTFVALTFKISLKGHIDFFDNDGFIKIYFYGIKVFKARIYFEHDETAHNNIVIEHGKKADKIHLNNDLEDKKSIMNFIRHPAFKNILIHQVKTHFYIGKNNSAFTTSLLLGGIRVLTYSALAFFKSMYKLEIAEEFTPSFNEDKLELDFASIITLSIADIIYSLLSHAFNGADKKREVKAVDNTAR